MEKSLRELFSEAIIALLGEAITIYVKTWGVILAVGTAYYLCKMFGIAGL